MPGSQVPTWSVGTAVSVLSPEYQRVVAVLAAADGSLVCKDIAAGLGLERVPAKVEGVRSKANRLVRRGWLVKEPSSTRHSRPGHASRRVMSIVIDHRISASEVSGPPLVVAGQAT